MLQKYITLIIAACCVFGCIVSCDPAKTQSEPAYPKDNILRIDLPAPINSLYPNDQDSGAKGIFPLLYSFLCVPDAAGELKPDLAVSWSYDPEKFAWTILLRNDAFFHDGRPVKATDVKHSLLIFHQKSDESLVDLIHDIATISDTGLRIYLKHNDPDFMQKIWPLEILPKAEEGSARKNNPPVGSGPFRFSSKTENQGLILKANKNYYLGPPSIDSVVIFYGPDGEQSWTRLISSQTDIAYGISPKNYNIMKQYEDRFYFHHYSMERYSILLYNTSDPLFADPLVRRALTQAIDRDYIISHFLNGYGKVAAGPMGIDSPYHNPQVIPLPYDPGMSLELMKKAGWAENPTDHHLYKNGKPFRFSLNVFEEFPMDQAIARYIKLCFNDIGIQMAIAILPFDSIVEKYRRNNDFQAVMTEFSDGRRYPEWLLECWSPCYCDKSRAGCFASPEVTKLLKQAFSETDPAKKTAWLQKADALIADLQPGTFLYHKTSIDVMSKRFLFPWPIELSHQGTYHLKDAVLIVELK